MLNIVEVPVALVPVIWLQVEPLLNMSVALSDDETSIECLYNGIISGKYALIVCTDVHNIVLVTVVNIKTYDTGVRALNVLQVAGNYHKEGLAMWQSYMSTMAKFNNCQEIVGEVVRGGWLRELKPYGWSHVREVIKFKLENEDA